MPQTVTQKEYNNLQKELASVRSKKADAISQLEALAQQIKDLPKTGDVLKNAITKSELEAKQAITRTALNGALEEFSNSERALQANMPKVAQLVDREALKVRQAEGEAKIAALEKPLAAAVDQLKMLLTEISGIHEQYNADYRELLAVEKPETIYAEAAGRIRGGLIAADFAVMLPRLKRHDKEQILFCENRFELIPEEFSLENLQR